MNILIQARERVSRTLKEVDRSITNLFSLPLTSNQKLTLALTTIKSNQDNVNDKSGDKIVIKLDHYILKLKSLVS
jgi:hypothetical protein